MICVIRLIINYVNQFFQMVGRSTCETVPDGLLSDNTVLLIHFNPVIAAGGLAEMKNPLDPKEK